VLYDRGQLAYLVNKVGANRVIMGTDYPVFLAEPDPVRFVRDAKGLSKAAQDAVLWRNAARLLGL
jgi:aminocarboxymuconate-semialdehyde decarboxylase